MTRSLDKGRWQIMKFGGMAFKGCGSFEGGGTEVNLRQGRKQEHSVQGEIPPDSAAVT